MSNETIEDRSQPRRAASKEWIGLGVLALPCLLYSMDLTVLNLALPALSADLKPSSMQFLWIVDIYGFMIAGSLVMMGTLGDRIGRRKLLMIGAAAFGFASILAAFSQNASQLIGARALLGIAGATLAPSTLSLISNMFLQPRQRTIAIGVWTTSFSVGGAIGPLLGGLFLQKFWWGSVFLMGLPGMVVLLILGPALLPEFKDRTSKNLDVLSALLSLLCILTFIYGIKQTVQEGFTFISLICILSSIGIGIIFVRRQKNLTTPFIELGLFKVPAFTAALVVNTISVFAVFGMFLYTSQYFQLVLGFSPLKSGMWMLPSSLGFIGGSMIAPLLRRHTSAGSIISACLFMASLGFGILTMVSLLNGLVVLTVASILFSFGTAVVITLGVDLIIGVVPPERTGAASGISETSTELGGALGIAILGSIGTAVFKSKMKSERFEYTSLNDANIARETIGAAVNLANEYPGAQKEQLIRIAQGSFNEAFILTSAISAILLFLVAVLSIRLLRNIE